MIVVVVVLRARLPVSRPPVSIRWPALMRSVVSLAARSTQRFASRRFSGAMFFCAFSAFWTTLAFLLATPPFHYGSTVAGAFGLVGVAGAAGRLGLAPSRINMARATPSASRC